MALRRRGIAIGILVLALAIIAAVLVLRPPPYRIGVILCSDSPLEAEANLAVRYWRERHPRVNGRSLQVMIRNPPLDERAIREAYAELAAQGAAVVVGGGLSRTVMPMVVSARESGVALVGITATTAELSGRADGFVRHIMDTATMGRAAAMDLAQRGHERVLAVADVVNRAYARSLCDHLAAAHPGQVQVVDFDLALDLESLLAPGPQRVSAIFAILPPDRLFRLMHLVRAIDPDVAVVTSDWGLVMLPYYQDATVDGIEFITQSGPLVEAFAADTAAVRATRDIASDFAISNALSSCEIAAQAVVAGDGDPARVWAWLAEPRTYDTAQGPVFVDRFGDATRSAVYRYRLVDGRLVEQDRMALDPPPPGHQP